jgi:hypothetical protein
MFTKGTWLLNKLREGWERADGGGSAQFKQLRSKHPKLFDIFPRSVRSTLAATVTGETEQPKDVVGTYSLNT